MRIELLKGIKDLKELKAAYRKLAMIFHPDKETGSIEKMQTLNAEYEYLNKQFEKAGQTFESTVNTEDFFKIIDELIHFENITIEIVGSWIWVSGETKPIKDTLNKLKFFWNRQRQLWQRKPTEEKFKTRNSKKDDSWIKDKYGCETIKGNPSYKKSIA